MARDFDLAQHRRVLQLKGLGMTTRQIADVIGKKPEAVKGILKVAVRLKDDAPKGH